VDSVSHDLQAPLRATDGFSQAILEDCADQLDAPGKGHLQRVRAASQRMERLIDAMLTMSRVSRSELHRTTMEFALVVKADPNPMHIVLENLLGNAWKFTSKLPTAKIEIGMTRHEGQGAYFVRDEEIGFDMKYADKLFGPFQRLHPRHGIRGHWGGASDCAGHCASSQQTGVGTSRPWRRGHLLFCPQVGEDDVDDCVVGQRSHIR
jgi:light-regulated signal transduction histidine kinase (bacteriophytochrome)